jgi:hypothetical protein
MIELTHWKILAGAVSLSLAAAGCSAGEVGGTPPDEPNAQGGTGGGPSTSSTGSSGSHAAGASAMGGGQPTGTGGTGALPPQVAPKGTPADCGIMNAAFCETFDTANEGGRAGPLDEQVWSFARYGHETRQFMVRIPASTEADMLFPSAFCGKPFSGLKVLTQDVSLCDGTGVNGMLSKQLNEVFDDQGDFAFNGMRIRQLFDFTDRTGTIVFDVDAKVNPYRLGHGWWVELFITDDSAPMPYHEAPGVISFPKNGIGFAFQGCDPHTSSTEWSNQLSRVFVSKNNQILHDYPGWDLQHESEAAKCFKTQDQKLNRFKFMISKDQAEVWASDFDTPDKMHRIAVATNLDLPFTRGYVHLEHAHYNARKDGHVTGVQTFRWDNVGFDGPTYALPKSYEVVDNDKPDIDGLGGRLYGYYLTDQPTTLPLKGVDTTGASKATFTFTIMVAMARSFQFSFNGHPFHALQVPDYGKQAAQSDSALRGFAMDVPVDEIVNGDNTVAIKITGPQTYSPDVVGNMELSLEAAK